MFVRLCLRTVSVFAISTLALVVFVFAAAASARAQQPPVLTGVVVDEAGGSIAAARVTVRDAQGATVQTAMSDAAGQFSVRGLAAGSYSIRVDIHHFVPADQPVTVSASGTLPALRVVLKAAGFSEHVVVTAQRVETRLAETPQKVEVVDSTDIERSVATDLTDVLKKNAGVDVVQYTGALSGIGIRGFRPQTAGVNKRMLLLVDGRPSGVTNLATLGLGNVDRIEILKGAASAIYGSSAMGGVVNVISRQSLGKVGGSARLGIGSFGTSEFAARAGGSATSNVDFDINANSVDQRDDIRMGNGVVRPATSYKTYDAAGRLGVSMQGGWRLDGRIEAYRGRDIASPPDIVSGTIGQSRKNIERHSGDGRLIGRLGAHDLSFVGYGASESSHTSNVTTSNPLDLPYLPYLSFESRLGWSGAQVQDSWTLSAHDNVVLGIDYETVTSVSHSYARTGAETAPFSANSNKWTAGFYAENTVKLRDGRTVLAAGARVDRITNETLTTPLKANFAPSASTFTVFNPSLGVKHELIAGLRGHFSIGRAFIPAEAIMLTGYTTTVVGGRTQINQGNPDLKPERSTSFDAGVEWISRTTRLDLTAFRTVVRDRFISNVVVSNPPPPDPIILSVTNGLDAHISGLDLEADSRLGRRVGVFANVTHYFSRKERLASGAEQDILNVALNTVRAGVDLDLGRFSARVSGRYVQGRRDNNFNAPGFPIVDYDNFTVVDATVTYRLVRQQSIAFAVNNLFDAFYYEKLGYPLQGASFKLSYRLGF